MILANISLHGKLILRDLHHVISKSFLSYLIISTGLSNGYRMYLEIYNISITRHSYFFFMIY